MSKNIQKIFEEYLASLPKEVLEKNELHKALLVNKQATWKSIRELFRNAEIILNLSTEEIIEKSDWHFADKQHGAIESLLGLIRVIFALNELGCSEIEMVKRQKKKPTPDIKAKYNNHIWNIEVKTFLATTQTTSKRIEKSDAYILYHTLLQKRTVNCIVEKLRQVVYEGQSSKQMIIIVLNDEVGNALFSNVELNSRFQEAVSKVKTTAQIGLLLRDGTYFIHLE